MTSQAADWTPLFKSLETNCQFTLRESNKVKVPKSFVKDIVSKKENDQGDSYDLTMKLKNATAFGSPLTKMVVKSDTGGGEVKLFFTNTDFMKSLSNFTFKDDNGSLRAGVNKKFTVDVQDEYPIKFESNASGYSMDGDSYGTILNFDRKSKTISCSSFNP